GGAEGGEPELPIEAGVVRGDDGRAAGEVAGFVGELVGVPGAAVIAAFDDEFGARGGHDGEETVVVERAEGSDVGGEGIEPVGRTKGVVEGREGLSGGEKDEEGGAGEGEEPEGARE